MTNANIPRLRFKQFDSEWKENKVGNLALVTKLAGFEFSKYVKYSDEGDIVALRGLNVKNDSLDLSDVKYIDYSDFSKLKRSKLFIDDILFTYVGTVGNSAIVKENDKFYLAPNVALIRIKDNNLNSSFFQKEISTDHYFRKVVYPLAASSSQMALSMESIRKFKFWYCGIDEQQKIGSFFAKIDKIIELQTQKLEQLKKLKQGYLQKMFPQDGESVPRLRFSGFSGEWKKKNISEITARLDNKRVPVKEQDRVSGNVPYYGANGIQGYVEGFTHTGNNILIAEDGASDVSNYPVIFTKGNIWVNNHAHVLQSKDSKSDSIFMSYALKLIRYDKYLTGNGRFKLNADVLMKITLLIPSLEEQQQISSFLSKLDQMINDQSDKIDKLKQQKKAYLQKMFF